MEGGPSALDDLKWVIGIVAAIWIVWFLAGGPAHYEAQNGVLLKPPVQAGGTGETYGTINTPSIKIQVPKTSAVSIVKDRISLDTDSNIGTSNPSKEYLTLVGASDSPVNVTGWKLTNKKGSTAAIGQGARIFVSGKINDMSDIYVTKGEKLVIGTGASPVGISFRTNTCSGYLSQFQDFYPSLENVCPKPADETALSNKPLDVACLSYLKDMSVCKTPVKTLPSKLSAVCREFILTHTSYNSCVDDNKSGGNFFVGGWRAYLNQTNEFFDDHDTIKFYDKFGTLIGTYTY